MTTCEKQRYVDLFRREHENALCEFERLSYLFKDVCWYNFETTCRSWRAPWRESQQDSSITLHGVRQQRWWARGHEREQLTFPLYYRGVVSDAPPLPPRILLAECEAAADYLRVCEQNITAPDDWAPGGAKYEALRETTLVGR